MFAFAAAWRERCIYLCQFACLRVFAFGDVVVLEFEEDVVRWRTTVAAVYQMW